MAWVSSPAPLAQTLPFVSQCDSRSHLGGLAHQHVLLARLHPGFVHGKRSCTQYLDDGNVLAHTRKRSSRDRDALDWNARERYCTDLISIRCGATRVA